MSVEYEDTKIFKNTFINTGINYFNKLFLSSFAFKRLE